jgi:hypothetical protein
LTCRTTKKSISCPSGETQNKTLNTAPWQGPGDTST